jgi:sorting nexin-8
VQEEFIGRSLPPALEDSLPPNLQEIFDTVRSGVRRSADLYINLCNLVERLCKRKEAIAAEYGRFGANLTSITATTLDTFAIDTNDVPLLNEGVKATAKHLSTSQSLLEDESRAWDEGVLEDLKSVRDGMVALRDLFDRRDRLARDNIPQLEKRIYASESKLEGIKAKGELAKVGEAEKVEKAIVNVSFPERSEAKQRREERSKTKQNEVFDRFTDPFYYRTNNRSSTNTRAAFSSASACATRSCFSRA